MFLECPMYEGKRRDLVVTVIRKAGIEAWDKLKRVIELLLGLSILQGGMKG